MNCRHCATALHAQQDRFIDLGSAPPSNAFLDAAALQCAETHLPLKVLACPACGLVQIDALPQREALFGDDYVYFSSYSASWLAHTRAYVDQAVHRLALGPRSLVMEVASNDGYLLQYLQQRDIPCVGVEPTEARRGPRARASNASANSSAWRWRSALPPSAAAATWCWATRCWRTCPTATTSAPGCARCWRPGAR